MKVFRLVLTGILFPAVMLIAGVYPAMAQDDDDECWKIKDKKVQKLFDQSQDRKKYEQRERLKFLKDALAMDEECAPCLFELGEYYFKKAQQDGTTMNPAKTYFSDLIKSCPNFHSDIYYYMGVIYYGEENYEQAASYFKKFQEYKPQDDREIARDWDKKKGDVKEILPEVEFYAEFFKKPVPYDPKMVPNVSTGAEEYLPMISPDNEILFYTRKVDRKAMGDLTSRIVEEFTMSYRDDLNKPFDAGKALPKPFNVGDNYGGATISVDNKEIIICACKKDYPKVPTYNNCDLYRSKYEKKINEKTGKTEYIWSELENLGPSINRPDSWEAQPSLSADGKTLYYAVIREKPGEEPNSDIYVSTRDANGNWTPGKSIGPMINTWANEKAPFIHSDSKTLYFAAEVNETHWGAGRYDIYYTRQKADGTWEKPQNIGYPINTEKDEHGLIVSTDGHLAYFASNSNPGGMGGYDIYNFVLPEKARPEKVVIVKGQLKDENGEPLKNAKVEISYTGSDKKEEVKVDEEDGKYVAVVNVEKGNDAVITVKAPERTYDSKLIAADSKTPVVKNADLKAEKIEVGKAYTMNDILFATNSYELNAKSKFVIDQFVVFLKENPKIKVAIHGHTDNVGNPQENLTLSDNRARAVMEYIVSKGISSSRLTSQGFGQTKPKVPNTSESNKALNRRTEFVITGI